MHVIMVISAILNFSRTWVCDCQPETAEPSSPNGIFNALTADQSGYYVLDTYGRLHSGGSAPAIAPSYSPHVGEDWARDFDLTLDGLGYYMLDKHGAIHAGGTAADLSTNLPPTWSDDTAIDIEVLGSLRLTDPYLGPHISPVLSWADLTGNGNRLHAFSLDNSGWRGTLDWTASTTPAVGWLDIQPPAGQTPGQVQLELTSLPPPKEPGPTTVYWSSMHIFTRL